MSESKMPPDDSVLCYVSKPWAYFTTQELSKQWGDDWGDAPYEHNAGVPYNDRATSSADMDVIWAEPRWRVYRVAFRGPWCDPAEHQHAANSPWSVKDINGGAVSWLIDSGFGEADVPNIAAGVSFKLFRKVVRAHGTLYVPMECAGEVELGEIFLVERDDALLIGDVDFAGPVQGNRLQALRAHDRTETGPRGDAAPVVDDAGDE